ncbi:MAG: hypothetical protein HQL15_08590 [Candidatus Omnitrophica bacterium]|nr:hypothetical protein [Candidatus Omnitrophota bacterium]
MSFLCKTIICLFLPLILPSYSLAEIVKLKSGQIIEGKILTQDEKSISIDVGLSNPVTYFSDEIQDILQDDLKGYYKKLKQKADLLEAHAIDAIDNNQMDNGIALMKQAVDVDSSPMRRMSYASILFGNGAAEYKAGKREEGTHVLGDAENQLSLAIADFHPLEDAVYLAQAYFLLGEIYLYAYANMRQAKIFYQKALYYYDNEGAKTALERLN